MTDRTQDLRSCRQNLGSRTGEFWKEHRRTLEYPLPNWFDARDPLFEQWVQREEIYARGEVELAACVQANHKLLAPAWLGAPGAIVHSPDPWFAVNADRLEDLAYQLYDMKGETTDDPEMQQVQAYMNDDMNRALSLRLPASLTEGRECYLTTIFFPREHLPNAWVARKTFPILQARSKTKACAVLPQQYWPNAWVNEWKAVPVPESCKDSESIVVEGYGWIVPVTVFGSCLALEAIMRAATGDETAYTAHRWPMAVAFAIAAIVLFAFDRWDRKRFAARYFAPECGHVLDVRFDRKFLWLGPRTWSIVTSALAVICFVTEWLR